MFDFLRSILSDKKDGELFTLFSTWHFAFLAIFVITFVVLFFVLKNKSSEMRHKVLDAVVGVAFGLYMLDFFLMPFAYGAIEIEKLPFHSCTLTCLLCFLSRHNKSLKPYKKSFAIIGFISNLSYTVVPAGVMWSAVTPLSYRCLQTILFHGVMTIYGMLALIYDDEIKLQWKKIYQELVVLCCMGVWAFVGNNLYSGTYPTYTAEYNWFFMRTDPFGILPQSVAPFVTIGFFFGCCAIIHAIYYGIKKLNKNKK